MEPAGELFFRCTACRRKLAVDARAVGHLVDCPNCKASLRVPEQSTIPDPIVTRRRRAFAFVAIGFFVCGAGGWLLATAAPMVAPAFLQRDAATGTRNEATAALAMAGGATRSRSAAGSAAEAAPSALREYETLQRQNRAISRQYEDLANWVLDNLRGRFLLKQQHLARLRFAPVTEDFSVNPELADFLTVNSHESTLMNDVFQYSRSQLLGLQQAHLSATQETPSSVTLYIPPFEREGTGLRDDLYGALQTVLGADRFHRFLEVGEQELTRSYDYFGAAARTMVFELVQDPQSPSRKPYVLIKDGWVIPQDESKRTTETSEEAVTELPKRYSSYLSWLPDFISAYATP